MSVVLLGSCCDFHHHMFCFLLLFIVFVLFVVTFQQVQVIPNVDAKQQKLVRLPYAGALVVDALELNSGGGALSMAISMIEKPVSSLLHMVAALVCGSHHLCQLRRSST